MVSSYIWSIVLDCLLCYDVMWLCMCLYFFFFSSRRRHTRCALVTGVQTCALPILIPYADESLPGLVARATREHVLEMTSVVLRRAGLRLSEPAALCHAPAEDPDRLAQVLGCQTEDMCDRTQRSFPNACSRGPVCFGAAVVSPSTSRLDRRPLSPFTTPPSDTHRATGGRTSDLGTGCNWPSAGRGS